VVNKKVTCRSLFSRGALILIGCTCLSLLSGFASIANAQTNQARKKVIVQTSKPVGFKDTAASGSSKTNSLNPALFQRKDPSELVLDSAGNLDYRVIQGCLRRNFYEDNLPNSIGIIIQRFLSSSKTKRRHFLIACAGNAFLTQPHLEVVIALTPSAS